MRRLRGRSADYDLADTHISAERLASYPMVFVQSTDFMDVADQRKLLAYVEAGGQVVIGPGLPYADPTLRLPGVLGQLLDAPGKAALGKGWLLWAETAELASLVATLTQPAAFRCDDPEVDLTTLRKGEQTLLYIANPTDMARTAVLRFDGRRRLQAIWNGEHDLECEGTVSLELPPYRAMIWEVFET
jgi:hypothetical protein